MRDDVLMSISTADPSSVHPMASKAPLKPNAGHVTNVSPAASRPRPQSRAQATKLSTQLREAESAAVPSADKAVLRARSKPSPPPARCPDWMALSTASCTRVPKAAAFRLMRSGSCLAWFRMSSRTAAVMLPRVVRSSDLTLFSAEYTAHGTKPDLSSTFSTLVTLASRGSSEVTAAEADPASSTSVSTGISSAGSAASLAPRSASLAVASSRAKA
mmetsp:Transcript_20341/g.78146  ORF Transcript_20341/g.78146 Transcript_20341/m.78146 type:complete len:216 (+) Transcript_20341:838-1485(+)